MNELKKLKNHELEYQLKNLVAKERKLLHVILEHIKEVDVRKLYLERAYSSLFEYLVKELGYSGSAAMRRINAARLLREVPSVSEKIQEGSLNLSHIAELSKAVKEKEKSCGEKISTAQKVELIDAIAGKNSYETQKELSQILDIELKIPERQLVQKDESVFLEITLSKEQHDKLLQCKDLASHLVLQNGEVSWASLFEVLADQYLSKHLNKHPSKRSNMKLENTDEKKSESAAAEMVLTRVDRESAKTTSSKDIEASNALVSKTMHSKTKPLKTLTPKTRQEIFKRDRCCQYKDKLTGKICGSTFLAQVDHKTSRWASGNHSSENLQWLCGRHNRRKYSLEAGIRNLN